MSLNINYINDLLNYEKLDGGLYIVPTPLGNLGDITLRSLKTLASVDLIICEDTRTSKKITNKFAIKTPLKPFHKFNSKRIIPELLSKFKLNKSIAIISDSGTPTISDPGADLISECVNHNVRVFSLPGPSAPIASVALSKFSTQTFYFRGFFPRENKKRAIELEEMARSSSPLIYFESAKRIISTLEVICKLEYNPNITFVRELTKKYEEVINSDLLSVLEMLKQRKRVLGEITFIIEPNLSRTVNKVSKKELIKISKRLEKKKLNISEISRIISKDLNIPKREIYQLLINIKQ